jgi:sigma-B regulation protein RsbU (phosphoserine phosphatase)
MQSLTVPGKLDSLEKIGKHVMRAARNAGLDKGRTYKLRLAVDEIATNIINYGYQKAGLVGSITVNADVSEHALTVTLEDSSGYYDPTLRPPPPAEYFTKPLEEREIGGWGVYLAIQSVDVFQYQRIQERNLNIFTMYRPVHGSLLLVNAGKDRSELISEQLTDLGYSVSCVEDTQSALELVRKKNIELVLLELVIKDNHVKDFIREIKTNNTLRKIPLAVLAHSGQLEEVEQLFKLGAEDYIELPLRPVILKERINSVLERHRMRRGLHNSIEAIKFERDHQIGQQFQLGFLPPSIPQPDGWEIAARIDPGEIPGDFYDTYTTLDGQMCLITGNVRDKGVTSALSIAVIRSLLRAFFQEYLRYSTALGEVQKRNTSSPETQIYSGSAERSSLKKVIEQTNNCILNDQALSQKNASIFFGILNPATGRLFYINAGSPHPVIINRGVVKTSLDKAGVMIGSVLNPEYTVEKIELELGDTLLLYTNGITDVRNSSGQATIIEVLLAGLANADLPANALLSHIVSNIKTIMGEGPFSEDITMLAVKRTT